MKGVSRSKFLLCLRPVVEPDHLDGRGASVGRAITYTGASSDKEGDGCSAEPVTCTQKRTLSRALRAVLNQIILRKRVRNKKGLSREGSSSPSSSSYASDENKREELENQETGPNSVSGSTKKPKSLSRNSIMSTKHTAAKQSFVDSGALLFLISLAITVLWGKLCAILLTSIWLYFLSHPRGISGDRRNDSPAATRLNETRSGGSYNKKRVIMEGMLEGNRRRAETENI